MSDQGKVGGRDGEVRRAQDRAIAIAKWVNEHPTALGFRKRWPPPLWDLACESTGYVRVLARYLRALPEPGRVALAEAKRELAAELDCPEHHAAWWNVTGHSPSPRPRFDLTPTGELVFKGSAAL